MPSFLVSFILTFLLSFSVYAQQKIVYSEHELTLRDNIWQLVVNSALQKNKFKTVLPPLRPEPSDFHIIEADLNEDGRTDYIASIDHFLFFEKNSYPTYIMIKDEYGYTQMPDTPRTSTLYIEVLPEMMHGYHLLAIDCNIYAFDGFTYREVSE